MRVEIALVWATLLGLGLGCEPIKIPMCQTNGYNLTRMPNLAGHKLQADANTELDTFGPLVESGCSSELQFFLCSVYAPMCVSERTPVQNGQDLIGPCRPLCQRVQQKCIPSLRSFGFDWPSVLDCSKFPESNNHEHMCMEPEMGGIQKGGGKNGISIINTLQTNPLFMEKVKQNLANSDAVLPDSYKNGYIQEYIELLEEAHIGKDSKGGNMDLNIQCPSSYTYVSRLSSCVQKCNEDSSIYKDGQKKAAKILSYILFGVTFAFFTLVIMSYCLGRDRFHYPEQILTIFSFCAFGLSLGSIPLWFLDKGDISCMVDGNTGDSYLTLEGHRNPYCFSSVIVVFFFTNAMWAWFTVWTFVSTVLELGKGHNYFTAPNFQISLYHLFGWGSSALLTLLIIVGNRGEADELTGMCYIGTQNKMDLRNFVIIPEALQLGLASFCLFVSTVRKMIFRNPAYNQQEHLGSVSSVIFSWVFFFALFVSLSSHILEYLKRNDWLSGDSDLLPLHTGLVFFRLAIPHLMGCYAAVLAIKHSQVHKSKLFRMWQKDKTNRSNAIPMQEMNQFPNVQYSSAALRQGPEYNQSHDYTFINSTRQDPIYL